MTRKDPRMELASIHADLYLLKGMTGVLVAIAAANLVKRFIITGRHPITGARDRARFVFRRDYVFRRMPFDELMAGRRFNKLCTRRLWREQTGRVA
jgi:hypothetical protein